MGRKVFVSYKYRDGNVKQYESKSGETTVRNYVDTLQTVLERNGHVPKCEDDEEDLSEYSDDEITRRLSNRIFDSTITIILISPGMKNLHQSERDQWIPWEISYSLRAGTRTSKNGEEISSPGNGMLGVVLPDLRGSYDYAITQNECCDETCITIHNNQFFEIIRKNMFNKKKMIRMKCETGRDVWSGEASYIPILRWDHFLNNMNVEIERAWVLRSNMDDYTVFKQLPNEY